MDAGGSRGVMCQPGFGKGGVPSLSPSCHGLPASGPNHGFGPESVTGQASPVTEKERAKEIYQDLRNVLVRRSQPSAGILPKISLAR